ncbi:bifunctional phosphopantothenoylcysteine decarboxylase/phosphopantothenate--cysteine ligase CoaBC [Spiroplasma chrysopicola]|uniref:Coenzyme A biosynthesis bifunctional protein CoaBC n=1 Tax=Spiroplasma chrysopicola DF-1 TaxID=1276227 RepID=R4UGD7_9MOLU|nr:bifunctional phosphopantothenoylcysteine decarboxylase/phosphopantothenate--cysteine ligase CoaBC [Spiroplasma chrysopicola]AGM25170.1 pantothenate metabolism flavoprotein [Spiroplasma chrysopicola DF-1]
MAKIILILTSSIAAPKGLALYQKLKVLHDVKLVLTPDVKYFLPESPPDAFSELFTQQYYDKNSKSLHIDLASQADLLVCYSASHNFIAKITTGITDNLASLVYSASDCYKMLFPAMNNVMYQSAANQRNLKQLIADGVGVFPPKVGLLACKTVGIGRAWEWEDVDQTISKYLTYLDKLKGKKVLLNFGRTKTYLDDIRYLTNNSSGLMGDALHQILTWSRCGLTTVVGDTDFPLYYDHIKVNTNQEMLGEMENYFAQQDIVICCAALNDYQIKEPFKGKIAKRQNPSLKLTLDKNIDVLAQLGLKKTHQFLVGFSAQNDFDLNYARQKLIDKNLDLLIINQTSSMQQSDNEIIFLTKTEVEKINKASKLTIAGQIIQKIISQC